MGEQIQAEQTTNTSQKAGKREADTGKAGPEASRAGVDNILQSHENGVYILDQERGEGTATAQFAFQSQAVRTILKDGETWFVAADVCKVLEHTNSRVAVSRLDDDEKGVSSVYTLSGGQDDRRQRERLVQPDIHVQEAAGQGLPAMGYKRGAAVHPSHRTLRRRRRPPDGRLRRRRATLHQTAGLRAVRRHHAPGRAAHPRNRLHGPPGRDQDFGRGGAVAQPRADLRLLAQVVSVRLAGLLEVDDPAILASAFLRGVGWRRAYGLGLVAVA